MSLKIIDLSGLGSKLTVDSTQVSVDSIVITVDSTSLETQTHSIKIPYRYYSAFVNLVLWNEIKEVETTINIEVVPEPGLMVLNFSHNFSDGETYEVKVLKPSDDTLIWRGNFLATSQTDLENYILHKKDNGIIKI